MLSLDFNSKDKIGEGGNANVYLKEDSSGVKFAVKVLKPEVSNGTEISTKVKRFMIEAIKIKELYDKGQKGIIPVLDFKLPSAKTDLYYYVMPYANPLKDKVQACKSISEIIDIFKDLATTLSELHKDRITHRDIKPENILFYKDKYCFADFGLIDFPEKEEFTKKTEIIGNRRTIAPEMRTAYFVDDSRPADVYSFAKTLWMVIAKEKYAFDGQFNYFENDILKLKYPKQHFVELYKLLVDATSENPSKRPTIDKFLERLIEWEIISKDDRASSKSLWRFIEENVVKQNNPSTVIWRNKRHVVEILKQLSILNFNHTFVPNGGGMDLIDIDEFFETKEPDMVKINFGLGLEVFKIKSLIWELPNEDPEFSYFRLEFDELDPIYPDVIENHDEQLQSILKGYDYKIVNEDLLVDSNGEYNYFNGDDEDERLFIRRWFSGTFLIVPKGSIYNHITETYDGRHAEFNADEFREYMELLQYFYRHEVKKKYFYSIARPNPFEDDNLAEIKKIRLMTNEELEKYIQDNMKN